MMLASVYYLLVELYLLESRRKANTDYIACTLNTCYIESAFMLLMTLVRGEHT